MNRGIQCVYQDLALVNKLSVIDNFFGKRNRKGCFRFFTSLE